MITRGMQRSNHGTQYSLSDTHLYFNHYVDSWPDPSESPLAIQYNAGIFTIPQASLSDYLVTWTVSIRTATVLDTFGDIFLFDMDYGNGEVTEEGFCTSTTAMSDIKAFKVIHIKRINTTGKDVLRFWILNRSFMNTIYLTTPSLPYPNGLTDNDIMNLNLCIMSL